MELEHKLQYHMNETDRLSNRLREELGNVEALQQVENVMRRDMESMKSAFN